MEQRLFFQVNLCQPVPARVLEENFYGLMKWDILQVDVVPDTQPSVSKH